MGYPHSSTNLTVEDVPPVVELRGGGSGVDGQAVTRIVASLVGDGTVWAELRPA
jgi:hypothetical protein